MASTPITTPNGAGVRGGATAHIVDGTTHKYWNGSSFTNVTTGLTNAKAKILEFNTAAARNTILVNGTDKKYWTGSGAASDITDGPATRFYMPDDSRMYAFKYPYMYASAIGTITDWTTLGDADKVIFTGMIGEATAFTIFNDMKIGWSDQTMHILLGKVSDEFDPSEPIPCGNISDLATLMHGKTGTLFWMDYRRYMAFTGSMPFDVSQKAKKYLELINYTYKANICAGQWGKYIYISFPYGLAQTTNNLTLEYDTENGTWYPWNIGIVNFFNIGEDLFGLTSGGVVKKLNQGTADDATAITWSHETGAYDTTPIRNKKTAGIFHCLVNCPVGSTMNLSYSTTLNGAFTSLYDFTPNADEQIVKIRIPTNILQQVNIYRLKISGVGTGKFHMLDPDIRIIP